MNKPFIPNREELIVEFMEETLSTREEAEWNIDRVIIPALLEIVARKATGLLEAFNPKGRPN